MLRALAAASLALLSTGCGSEQKLAYAAGTAAVAVAAAAVHRAATDYCWGSCSHGYVCNRETGACELPPETRPAPAPSARSDAGCIEEDDGRIVCPDDPPAAGGSPPAADACRNLCLANERCIVRDGVADCVP